MKFERGQSVLVEPSENTTKNYVPHIPVTTFKYLEDYRELGKGQNAIEAVEKYVIKAYTSLTRAITSQWGWDSKDLAKLRYEDKLGQRGGSLVASIKRSRIIEYLVVPEEQWIIEVVPNIGIELEAEEYIVYQERGGNWVVRLWR